MRVTRSAARLGSVLLGLGLCMTVCLAYGAARQGRRRAGKTDPVAVGYEIFNREWMPNDSRGHGGDGLGPVYNDSSCVACHNSGGSGGAGPSARTSTSSAPRVTSGSDAGGQVARSDATSTSLDHPGTDRLTRRPSLAVIVARPAGRDPSRVPDQPERRAPQVRHRPELRRVEEPVLNPAGPAPAPEQRERLPTSSASAVGADRPTSVQTFDSGPLRVASRVFFSPEQST